MVVVALPVDCPAERAGVPVEVDRGECGGCRWPHGGGRAWLQSVSTDSFESEWAVSADRCGRHGRKETAVNVDGC